MSLPILMLQNKTHNPRNKKGKAARPILQIRDIEITTMVVDLDQGVVVDQGVPLSAVETVEAWIVDWNNIKTLSIQIQTSKEATQVVRDLLQVELRRQVQEHIYRLKMQVTLTVWIKLDSNNSVQIQLNRRIKSQRLQLILWARVCRLEE